VTSNIRRLIWVAVALSAAVGVVVAIVILRGDPSFLIQDHDKAGRPYGEPHPVSFAFRAFSVTILVASLISAGRRAVSEDGILVWPVAVAGYALFVLDVIASSSVGKLFPAFLVVAWLTPLLPLIVYSEPIGEYLRGPPWLIWGFCLLALAARGVWLAYLWFSM
jgi:hypothetical protein